MERKIEYRFAPLTLDEGERKVAGIATPWDSIGQGDFGPEKFSRSAFGPVDDFQMFNLTVQHNRGLGVSADLNFRDTPKGLEVDGDPCKHVQGKRHSRRNPRGYSARLQCRVYIPRRAKGKRSSPSRSSVTSRFEPC